MQMMRLHCGAIHSMALVALPQPRSSSGAKAQYTMQQRIRNDFDVFLRYLGRQELLEAPLSREALFARELIDT